MGQSKKKSNSTIKCDVVTCDHNNCEEGTCRLDEVEISCSCASDECADCT